MNRLRILTLGAALLTSSVLLGACGSLTEGGTSSESASQAGTAAKPYAVSAVALDSRGGVSSLKVGVLVGPVEGSGSEFRPLVEGANLAARRFAAGGVDVELRVALDDGTVSGARTAVESLISAGVSGILVESQLDAHMEGATAIASEAKTPLISLYSPSTGQGAWSLSPSAASISDVIGKALDLGGAAKPFVVTGSERTAPITGVQSAGMEDLDGLVARIKTAYESRQIDSVVISATASEQAALVAKLEGGLAGAPVLIILTPEALTPTFGSRVLTAGVSEGRLIAVGRRSVDETVLGSDEAGNAASAFFTAMRLGAGDESCENLYKDAGCEDSLPWADAESHDGVVALVRAVEAAESTEPSRVLEALSGLVLGIEDGLVGAPLDFRNSDALPSSAVLPLRASTSNPGTRPLPSDGDQVGPLFWFVE